MWESLQVVVLMITELEAWLMESNYWAFSEKTKFDEIFIGEDYRGIKCVS